MKNLNISRLELRTKAHKIQHDFFLFKISLGTYIKISLLALLTVLIVNANEILQEFSS
jgi:hypothetical protein